MQLKSLELVELVKTHRFETVVADSVRVQFELAQL